MAKAYEIDTKDAIGPGIHLMDLPISIEVGIHVRYRITILSSIGD